MLAPAVVSLIILLALLFVLWSKPEYRNTTLGSIAYIALIVLSITSLWRIIALLFRGA